MTCARCGAGLAGDAAFCSACGLATEAVRVALVTPPHGSPNVSEPTIPEGRFGTPYTLAGLTDTGYSAVGPFTAGVGQTPAAEILARLRSAIGERYTLDREVGRGGMATVFRAVDLREDREVAIKVLHPELAATLGGGRFEREIRLATQLRHPHILGLLDSGTAEGLMYYVMPFVRGESLRDRLNREGQLPLEDALQVTLQVCDALGFAHQQGVVHRDIKPENILLDGGQAVVADFGIARAVSEAGQQKLTQTGMAVGTPVYMAPEQSVGDKVGPTADLYSLGCVLYEMLAGEPPFGGKNAMAIMARHAMGEVPSVRVVRVAVPEHVEGAIYAVMAKAPVDRPQTAAAFAALLAAGAEGAALQTRAFAAARRVPTAFHLPALAPPVPLWRRRGVLAGALAVVAIAGAGAALSGRGGRPARADDPLSGRVAVLYFDDRSPGKQLGPLADGLTEGLIGALGTAPSLTVVSRSGVEPFRGTALPADSITRALSVRYLVRGALEPVGQDVRVTLSLDDENGRIEGKSLLVRASGNLLATRDSLSLLAADLLKEPLGRELTLSAQRASTSNPQAWLLVRRGEQARRRGEALNAQGDSAGFARAFREADSLYAAAETADARWSEPTVARAALAYRRSRLVGRDPAQIRAWVTPALALTDQALARDSRDPDAYEVRGNVRYWSWLSGLEAEPARQAALLAAARADLEKATQLNKNQAGAWASLSHLYNQTGTATDVNIAATNALAADEFLANADVILGRLFNSSYDLAQFDKATQWCDRLQQRFPTNRLSARCQLYLLTARTSQPDVARAWALADTMVARAPAPRRDYERRWADLFVAAVLARAGQENPALADSARRVAARAAGDATVDATRDLAFIGAWVHTVLGDRDDALRLLKQYLAANPTRAAALGEDPGWWFRDLAADPRFRQLTGAQR